MAARWALGDPGWATSGWCWFCRAMLSCSLPTLRRDDRAGQSGFGGMGGRPGDVEERMAEDLLAAGSDLVDHSNVTDGRTDSSTPFARLNSPLCAARCIPSVLAGSASAPTFPPRCSARQTETRMDGNGSPDARYHVVGIKVTARRGRPEPPTCVSGEAD